MKLRFVSIEQYIVKTQNISYGKIFTGLKTPKINIKAKWMYGRE